MGGLVQISGMTFIDETDGEFIDDTEEFDPVFPGASRRGKPSSEENNTEGGEDESADTSPGWQERENERRREAAGKGGNDTFQKLEDSEKTAVSFTCVECNGNAVPSEGDICDSCVEAKAMD